MISKHSKAPIPLLLYYVSQKSVVDWCSIRTVCNTPTRRSRCIWPKQQKNKGVGLYFSREILSDDIFLILSTEVSRIVRQRRHNGLYTEKHIFLNWYHGRPIDPAHVSHHLNILFIPYPGCTEQWYPPFLWYSVSLILRRCNGKCQQWGSTLNEQNRYLQFGILRFPGARSPVMPFLGYAF